MQDGLMSPPRYPSPLRYPGGKGKVANFLKLLITENDLCGIDYVEPYAGGASVALSLLFEEYVNRIHMNDLNKGVYLFWKLVLENPDELCSRIRDVQVTPEEWKHQKGLYTDPNSSPEEIGFATFFLNRTNRSGIIARGGMIGGTSQEGEWRLDARFNRESLSSRVEKIARFSSRITVTMKDAIDLVSDDANCDHTLYYLDPPYYVKGARLYDNSYNHADHVSISNAVKGLKSPWIVSYDAADPILKMYADAKRIEYSLGYSASTTSTGSEVMFFSSGLNLPTVDSPAGITTRMVNLAKSGTLF